ncbi:S-formylglutathione hydrolase [Lautropia dentalis]|jgi:S-formylglutathione hydrolase|uniref:S-formylglutathione hydrolase n=1 Tax=Lautropia dentalis TaxID=2490857 RepID=A0A426FQ60_9BURK|nr:S-formylglutathione hydrolase [Lautropia dentalis]RRN44856.1 S-formylglutathione hydrolase [Lautropia dentalis]
MKRTEQHACFGGRQEVWQHESTCTGTAMNVAVYLPPLALAGEKCPVLYWLSGLTCNEQNFITKAGAQQYAAQRGIILVAPDTSPRGSDLQGHAVADDEAYDLGQGAGFYVNATQAPWAPHFRMYDYVVEELPALIEAHFPATQVRAISGHSMGGHGALTIALRNPARYRSVSAFAPIVAPSQVPWGQKALRTYLGDDPAAWAQYDAVAMVKAQGREWMGLSAPSNLPILIDQGTDDPFLQEQLRPELLKTACAAAGQPLELRLQPGYDHSYYFIATFIGEHIGWHARILRAGRDESGKV